MKAIQYILFLSILLFSTGMQAQCYVDRHDTSPESSWESCSTSQSPNTVRGNTHWIMYDMGHEYELGQLHFWNYNHYDNSNNGARDIIIDYSTNGSTWNGGINFTLDEANTSTFYEGQAGPQLDGVAARYLLINISNNYGGTCAGFSEIRIGIHNDPCGEITMQRDEVPIINGLYHAEQTIFAEGLVNATSEVMFKAENAITLEAGFSTKLGAEFEAIIADCPN